MIKGDVFKGTFPPVRQIAIDPTDPTPSVKTMYPVCLLRKRGRAEKLYFGKGQNYVYGNTINQFCFFFNF